MDTVLTLQDVQRALAARDPDLWRSIVALAGAPDQQPEQPLREGTPNWWEFLRNLGRWQFRSLKAVERTAEIHRQFELLEAEGAEAPLPDRVRLHGIIRSLADDNGPYARAQLLDIIANVPLRFGVWKALKQLYKDCEQKQDWELLGALIARFDRTFALPRARRRDCEVSQLTLGYLVRRGWRLLRHLGETLPACYADAACEVLRFYPDETDWSGTWVSNHIFYQGTNQFTRRRFKGRRSSSLLKYRAFADLWRRTPRPLFTLLERACAEQVRRFAATALRTDFRTSLREVEPAWVARLVSAESEIVDEFVIWLLDNVPKFEQASYRQLGLHATVLALLDSPHDDARAWAAAYGRTHARDLSLDELIRFANNDHEAVRAMARDLLADRDPRKDIGLEGYGRLLGTRYGHDLAVVALRKHFGASELTPEWFKARLLSTDDRVVTFACERLAQVHPEKKLGAAYFRELLDAPELGHRAAEFALDALERLGADALTVELVRVLLLDPKCRDRALRWLSEGRMKPSDLGADYLKSVAFHLTFEADPFVASLKTSGRKWASELTFDETLSERALAFLGDVRQFSPTQLGFDWLMQLVARSEERYHDFAVEYMTKAFVPGDFAVKSDEAPAAEAAPSSDGPIAVDLKGASFLFTGKLATMTRGVAENKVTAANGTNAGSVTKNLDYLVVGDEGSPLYGQGKKGSKQVAAEKLLAKGEPIRIISETAFLQMLAGETRKVDDNSTESGCERLWEMAVGPGKDDAPLATFARHYIRRHHQEICPFEIERHVDPGAEIPASFLTFERVKPSLADPRPAVREFALLLAKFELARWKPPMDELVALCELEHDEVRDFVTLALTADDAPEHARYRVDPAVLTADAVYRFCESLEAPARALGMTLIGKNPRLAIPEELFRLTESPDRQVRAFVVRQLWTLYRSRGVTATWKPAPKVETGKKKDAVAALPAEGLKPRPEGYPAKPEDVRAFFRRTLFGIPPARPPKAGKGERLKPLPARQAKLALIEVVRDLALEDAQFASLVLPLFAEFTRSRGESERLASLVALTRIRLAHPGLEAA